MGDLDTVSEAEVLSEDVCFAGFQVELNNSAEGMVLEKLDEVIPLSVDSCPSASRI